MTTTDKLTDEALVHRAVLDWIKEDAPIGIKMQMTPDLANKLSDRIAHRRASQAAPAPSDGLREAVEAERERIAVALEAEADLLPCAEDAAVTRSNAALIRADFSYEDADRAALTPAPAQEGDE